ncbi:MAG TPA: nitrilase-related carbon-nitrogen hydrolase [Bacillota bacterium]|nr:nitrilase-related carbon-nitrogen hydrolase [Bacillota bacterium]
MRVAALSLAGIDTGSLARYRQDLSALLKQAQAALAVLPAHTALKLYYGSTGPGDSDFARAFLKFMEKAQAWNDTYLNLHADLAKSLQITLAAGTTVEECGGLFYQTAYCFGPEGDLCAAQRQTHLSREERLLGLSRGEDLALFDCGPLKAGIAAGTDAYHPEVGRIFALQGADLVIHAGALPGAANCRRQAAGMWAQVQQNHFWAVEAQLYGNLCGRFFGGECCIIGPCEVTGDLSGFLCRAVPSAPAATAELDESARQRLRQIYPLLDLLHPEAYEA